jgi:hypothetical protein
MGTLSDQVESLALRFPAQADVLRRLYMREPRFRTICDEYNIALRAYEHWNAEETAPLGGKRDLRQSDFYAIMHELEIEIQELVKKEAQKEEE